MLIEVWISGNENSVLIRCHSAQLCICSESLWIIRAIERLRKDIYNSSVRFTGQLPLGIPVHFFADNLFSNLTRQVFQEEAFDLVLIYKKADEIVLSVVHTTAGYFVVSIVKTFVFDQFCKN